MNEKVRSVTTAGIIIALIFCIALQAFSVIQIVHNQEEYLIEECNLLYGEPTWNKGTYTIMPVDEYASYSQEFYETHPIIYIGGGLFSRNKRAYTCFEINNNPKRNISTTLVGKDMIQLLNNTQIEPIEQPVVSQLKRNTSP